MAEVKNTFLKGKMNKDLDSRLIPKGEYREAVNLQVSRSEGSTVGEFESVRGNSKLFDVYAQAPYSSSGDKPTVLGYFSDDINNTVYIFASTWNENDVSPGNSAGLGKKCSISRYNITTDTYTLLVTGDFLNFNISYPINNVNLVEGLLYWTDNLNQPRKININLANPTNSTTPTHYQNEDQISVAKYYPYQAIVAMERTRVQADNISAGLVLTLGATIPATVKVGDIITNFDKDFTPAPTITTLITVVKLLTTTTLQVSAAFTFTSKDFLDFSRPSMVNKARPLLSNGFKIKPSSVAGQTAGSAITLTSSQLPGDAAEPLTPQPTVGMLVTGTGINVSPTVVASVSIAGNITTITLDENTNALTTGSLLTFGSNPNYDASWKGDPEFLSDKYVRFSYRFKFEDNEYSLMAPFTQSMFIPRQYGEFGKGQNTTDKDMEDAYQSTILAWFKNNTDSIKLKIPIPDALANGDILQQKLLVSDIEVLYKESDSLAVKVLDSATTTGMTFTTIQYSDLVHGAITQTFFDYNYESSKPYKTLPESQTVRVYDKVPVRALTQEVIGNRIVYGNYLDSYTSPTSINYSATVGDKSVIYDNYAQFTNSSLKENRTYQVGIVLADRYGRSSTVILSSNDENPNLPGSTIFAPYKNVDNNDVFNWLGDALRVTFNAPITTSQENGQPGIYQGVPVGGVITATLDDGDSGYSAAIYPTTGGSGTGCTVKVLSVDGGGGIITFAIQTPGSGYAVGDELILTGGDESGGIIVASISFNLNPLGWFSYKIVVKQQEQDYYNCFLPGFINGYPITQTKERNESAFTVSLGDNINKIPRDLGEVGVGSLQFNSSVRLFGRVNNPNINRKQINVGGTILPFTNHALPYNQQYYPETFADEVTRISTCQESELATQPFVASVSAGVYNSPVTTATTAGQVVTTASTGTGSIPWGTTGALQSFYNQDANPFLLELSVGKENIVTNFGTVTDSRNKSNQLGAIVTSEDGSGVSAIISMQPFLTVSETTPTTSLLDIFWESSSTGSVAGLNSNINAQYSGVTSVSDLEMDFFESAVPGTVIDAEFFFKDGSGTNLITLTDAKIFRIQNSAGQTISTLPATVPFILAAGTSSGSFSLKTSAAAVTGYSDKYFWYGTGSPVNDVYTITFETDVTVNGVRYVDQEAQTVVKLKNLVPIISGCPKTILGITTQSTTIVDVGAVTVNGSADVANNNQQISYSIVSQKIGATDLSPPIFEITSAGVLKPASGQVMANDTTYIVVVRATDNAGNISGTAPYTGLSDDCSISFTVGTQHINRPVCDGLVGTDTYPAGFNVCADNRMFCFVNSKVVNIGQTTSGATNTYNSTNGYWANSVASSTSSIITADLDYLNVVANWNAQPSIPARDSSLGGLNADALLYIEARLEATPYTTSSNTANCLFTIQWRPNSSTAWSDATYYKYSVDSGNTFVVGNGTVPAAQNLQVLIPNTGQAAVVDKLRFYFNGATYAGEYRIFNNEMTGDVCGDATAKTKVKFTVDFGDGNAAYAGQCSLGPS